MNQPEITFKEIKNKYLASKELRQGSNAGYISIPFEDLDFLIAYVERVTKDKEVAKKLFNKLLKENKDGKSRNET